ncbi:MAG: phosphotransferase [Actinomycetia bacterium]|nr:phosphotransferase [Actinomycetes bacterium]MCP5034958.1 phosphotransferase [Actinomycetes bacterium]
MASSDVTEYEDGSEPPRLGEPSPSVWTELGLTREAEVHGGHQSKVFLATGQAGPLIVKLARASPAADVLRQRVEIIRQLADINRAVVGPLELRSNLVTDVGQWRVVCYPYVEGTSPDTDDRCDAEAMAETLAMLHDSLATLTEAKLPLVAALRGEPDDGLRHGQVIHGDYAAANLIVTRSGLKVIDFDDCGHGSVEFEIGNSLYMVLFDAWYSGTPYRYERFRSWFVDAYRNTASFHIEEALLDEAIGVRARALARWLAKPTEAPEGIRTSSPEWRQRLRSFVDDMPWAERG